ncbi:MAG: hypothetical protein KGV59_01445 [Tenacibaculum sp.]|nr:hypothetical protein [Tenacibaculum sp.]
MRWLTDFNLGTSANDGRGDGIRTTFKKIIDNLNFLKNKYDDLMGKNPVILENHESPKTPEGFSTFSPPDAFYMSAIGRDTGAIKIKLPVSKTSTTVKIWVDVFDFKSGGSFTMIISGYNSSRGWETVSCQTIGSEDLVNYTVRFGASDSKDCIYIGELNTVWTQPKVIVSKVFLSQWGSYQEYWYTGWNISIEKNQFENISATLTNNRI